MPCHAESSGGDRRVGGAVAVCSELPGAVLRRENRICTIQAEGLLRAHGLLMRGRCDDANHPGHVLETVFEFVIWINL